MGVAIDGAVIRKVLQDAVDCRVVPHVAVLFSLLDDEV
jgi:hypothetical protein